MGMFWALIKIEGGEKADRPIWRTTTTSKKQWFSCQDFIKKANSIQNNLKRGYKKEEEFIVFLLLFKEVLLATKFGNNRANYWVF